MEQAGDLPEWVEEKHSVGWRAEMYSLRRERAQLGVDQVSHISRDIGDGFGYDIETTVTEPSRYIEVKGSRAETLTFVLTTQGAVGSGGQPGSVRDPVLGRDLPRE